MEVEDIDDDCPPPAAGVNGLFSVGGYSDEEASYEPASVLTSDAEAVGGIGGIGGIDGGIIDDIDCDTDEEDNGVDEIDDDVSTTANGLPRGVSSKRTPPEDGSAVPPSLTRKRQKSKQLQLVPFDMSARPAADGRWRCDGCDAEYGTRTGLFGHVRFCEARCAWQCEWCKCTVADTHHKGNGPNGAKTLCSACSGRYRAGHNSMPEQNERGEWVCERCLRGFPELRALGGHRRFCDGGVWRCGWCKCSIEETQGKGPGPEGAGTLCSACSGRYRGGATGLPPTDEDGKYICDLCNRTFETISGYGSHRGRCDGGVWRCGWCQCSYEETTGKGARAHSHHSAQHPSRCVLTRHACCNHVTGPGPDGAKTLCAVCSARHRSGHSGPPPKTEDGRYPCELCSRTFETFSALGVHKRRCDGGVWRCGWCGCSIEETSGKGPGPEGAGTLCSACSGRHRGGYAPPSQLSPLYHSPLHAQ